VLIDASARRSWGPRIPYYPINGDAFSSTLFRWIGSSSNNKSLESGDNTGVSRPLPGSRSSPPILSASLFLPSREWLSAQFLVDSAVVV